MHLGQRGGRVSIMVPTLRAVRRFFAELKAIGTTSLGI